MLNLDTHILIFALRDELTPRERQVIRGQRWSISSIVLWEIERLFRGNRIPLGLDDRRLTRLLARIVVHEITPAIALATRDLDFASDPADELIAATSLTTGVPLLTRDRRLRASRVIPLA